MKNTNDINIFVAYVHACFKHVYACFHLYTCVELLIHVCVCVHMCMYVNIIYFMRIYCSFMVKFLSFISKSIFYDFYYGPIFISYYEGLLFNKLILLDMLMVRYLYAYDTFYHVVNGPNAAFLLNMKCCNAV